MPFRGNRRQPVPQPDRLELSVLLVDDDLPTRRSLAYLLRQCRGLLPPLRVTCIEAATGIGGIALALDPAIRFVFLDYHMPDMTGLDFLTTLLKHRPMLPVVLLTGNEHPSLPAEAVRRGAYDVLMKAEASHDILNRSLWQGLEWATLHEKLHTHSAQSAQHELHGLHHLQS